MATNFSAWPSTWLNRLCNGEQVKRFARFFLLEENIKDLEDGHIRISYIVWRTDGNGEQVVGAMHEIVNERLGLGPCSDATKTAKTVKASAWRSKRPARKWKDVSPDTETKSEDGAEQSDSKEQDDDLLF